MGNAASCAAYSTSAGSIKVIDIDGGAEEYVRPIRAAELMLENPGQFVCDSNHLNVGCRIPGLAADEELRRRRLYFLLPMDMLYSVLTDEEMASLSRMASGATRRGTRSKNIGRIFPVLSDFCLSPVEAKKAAEPTRSVAVMVGDKVSRQRSWRPALDTIEEAPCMK